MEKVKVWNKESLITELTQGKEFVNQFDPLASPEENDFLLEKILSSIDKSLSILNCEVYNGTNDPFPLRDQGQNKKRKKMQQWSKQVRVHGTELESFNHDDGYSWRKYGQKNILGAIHPRAYYRCTHRNTQGCLATKQVQKSEQDPLVFDVTYKGMHSCKTSHSSTFISYEKQKPNQCQIKKQRVENLNTIKEETVPFTPLQCESHNAQCFVNSIEPLASESMYLSLLPYQEEEFEMDKILQSSESDRIVFSSTPTSIIDSPFSRDWDLSVNDQLDVHDPNLMIDISEYFT
ncbi:probable WRKY transcription factor 30 [Solanum lycopersicum]|uniref:WRKY domain-containing protein n=1 Tax=Solanum lycopersicum TaxID=4081 RepID=A0A3Q7ICZ9_SOLLC|nr:probable WRKY transcription factor 30 [Solanum lycopersicum]